MSEDSEIYQCFAPRTGIDYYIQIVVARTVKKDAYPFVYLMKDTFNHREKLNMSPLFTTVAGTNLRKMKYLTSIFMLLLTSCAVQVDIGGEENLLSEKIDPLNMTSFTSPADA